MNAVTDLQDRISHLEWELEQAIESAQTGVNKANDLKARIAERQAELVETKNRLANEEREMKDIYERLGFGFVNDELKPKTPGLCALILFAVLLLAPMARAQHSSDHITLGGTFVTGGTNNCPALATNVYDTVHLPRGQYAGIHVQFAAPASSTSNLVVRVDVAADGPNSSGATNWMPNVWVYPIAANGVARTTHFTNITIGAAGCRDRGPCPGHDFRG
jgi:hypothetical protein